jgi:hypothetical protein
MALKTDLYAGADLNELVLDHGIDLGRGGGIEL